MAACWASHSLRAAAAGARTNCYGSRAGASGTHLLPCCAFLSANSPSRRSARATRRSHHSPLADMAHCQASSILVHRHSPRTRRPVMSRSVAFGNILWRFKHIHRRSMLPLPAGIGAAQQLLGSIAGSAAEALLLQMRPHGRRGSCRAWRTTDAFWAAADALHAATEGTGACVVLKLRRLPPAGAHLCALFQCSFPRFLLDQVTISCSSVHHCKWSITSQIHFDWAMALVCCLWRTPDSLHTDYIQRLWSFLHSLKAYALALELAWGNYMCPSMQFCLDLVPQPSPTNWKSHPAEFWTGTQADCSDSLEP